MNNYSKLSREVNNSTQGNPTVQALMRAVGNRLDEIEFIHNEQIKTLQKQLEGLNRVKILL